LTGSIVPSSAFFLGLGASANWTNFGHQHVYAIGTSNVFTDGVLSASGSAQGPTNIHMEDRFAFAPSFQALRRQRLAMGSKTLVQLSGSNFDQHQLHYPAIRHIHHDREPYACAF
jgi:hypothetical protein